MQSSFRLLRRVALVNHPSTNFRSCFSPSPLSHQVTTVKSIISGSPGAYFHSSTPLQGLGDPTEPEVPLYDALNIQVKGYDFAVLEKFARYVHRTAERIGLDVEDSWATPAQNFKITQLKPESVLVESEYHLNLYERNVQIVDVPSTILPVLVNIVEASLPAGVTMRVHPHLPEHTELRYVPDLELKDLKQQLQDMSERKNK